MNSGVSGASEYDTVITLRIELPDVGELNSGVSGASEYDTVITLRIELPDPGKLNSGVRGFFFIEKNYRT